MNAVEEFARLRDRLAADLAACIAPELQAMGAVDIAIITESDLSRVCTGLHGFYGYNLRDLYADELGHRKHAETGPGIVICDVTTAKDCARPATAVEKMIGTAIHETVHAILSPVPFGRFDNGLSRREFKRIAEHEPPAAHVLDRREPEFPIGGHDADFVRLAIHLAARMRARGWEVADDRLWHPSTCGLSYGRAYRRALQTELESAAELPLTAILRLPPPAEFVDLFERNRRRAMERPEMSFLSKLKQKQQTKVESAAEKYRRFAVAVADGKAPDENELLAVLADLGRTLEDFENRVEAITQRRETKARADRSIEIREQLQAAEAAMLVLQQEHLERQRVFDEAARDYQQRRNKFNLELMECEKARQELRRTAPQELLDQIQALHGQKHELDQRRSRYAESLFQGQGALQRAKNAVLTRQQHYGTSGELADHLERQVEIAQAAVDEREERVRAIDQEIGEVLEQIAALEPQVFVVE
jgi:hypothetical protein